MTLRLCARGLHFAPERECWGGKSPSKVLLRRGNGGRDRHLGNCLARRRMPSSPVRGWALAGQCVGTSDRVSLDAPRDRRPARSEPRRPMVRIRDPRTHTCGSPSSFVRVHPNLSSLMAFLSPNGSLQSRLPCCGLPLHTIPCHQVASAWPTVCKCNGIVLLCLLLRVPCHTTEGHVNGSSDIAASGSLPVHNNWS